MPYVILVCNDDADADCISKAFELQPGKIPVSVFASGVQLLQHLDKSGFGNDLFLIIIDQYLPEMTSQDLLREIRNGNGQKLIPVAMMGGFATVEVINDYYRGGANCFYKKPMDQSEWNHMADCLLTLFAN